MKNNFAYMETLTKTKTELCIDVKGVSVRFKTPKALLPSFKTSSRIYAYSL